MYETKHETFEDNNKKKVVVVVVVRSVVVSVGRLGETWVGWPDLCRPIFQVLYTVTFKYLITLEPTIAF